MCMGYFLLQYDRDKITEEKDIRMKKKIVLIASFLFFSSCGTASGLTDVEERKDSGQQIAVTETIEETSQEEMISSMEGEAESVEVFAETIEETPIDVPFVDNPSNSSFLE